MSENAIPGIFVGISTWGDDFDVDRATFFPRHDLPDDLPAPPLPLNEWTLDIGLPLEGMGFRFECDFAGIEATVPCEVHAEKGVVDVDREEGIEELADEGVELPEDLILWLMDACPRVVRHLFAPLLAR